MNGVTNQWIVKDKKFIAAIVLNVWEGILTGSVLGAIFVAIRSVFAGQYDGQMLLYVSFAVAGLFLLRFILYSYGYTIGHIGGAITAKNMRLFLGDKIKRLPLINFSQKMTGHYINIVTNDVNQYENVLTHKAGDIAKNIAMITIMLVFLTFVNPVVGMINIVLGLTVIPAIWLSLKAVQKYGGMKKQILVDHVSHLVEYISGIQTFRSYGMGGTENNKVNKALKNISDISYTFEAKVIPIGSVFSVLVNVSIPLSILIVGYQWIEGAISATTAIVCMILPLYPVRLLETLFVDFTAYKNLMLSKQAMNRLVEEPEETADAMDFQPQEFAVRFDQVCFAYDEQPLFENLSFTADNGKLTAIVGNSGSGKTTVLNLISKFYQVQGGTISIGGLPTNGVHSEQILRYISMVYQDVFLFNDTIKNNIAFANPQATDQEIIEACKQANCHQFIVELENGYDTIVGENGSRLSGGERQRISIARAFLKNSPIILLDEATSSLDIENELAVKQAIDRLLQQQKTVIMIAHNLSVIRNADQILVMSNGRIIEQGTHQQLLDEGGKYYSMWSAEV